MKKILVVAAHPDDEVVGCGGAIAYHAHQGDEVYLLIMADGVSSRFYDPKRNLGRPVELKITAKDLKKRQKETIKAMGIFDIKSSQIHNLNLADQRLDIYPFLDLVKSVEQIKKRVNPDIVYTHFYNDLNLDHRLTCQVAYTAFRPKAGKKNVKIYQFEIPESTYLSIPGGEKAFKPNHFVDISLFMDKKLKALSAYISESRQYPNMRSVEYIKEVARKRGRQAKSKFAEAFLTI